MTVEERTPVPGRTSAAERAEAIRKLRDGAVSERLSLDTFSDRVEGAYRARTRAQLAELVADLDEPRGGGRLLDALVGRLSRATARIGSAWREARTPSLALPASGDAVTLGRAPGCDCVLVDPTVSRRHASLVNRAGSWWLRDLGSSNGTRVNGWRVVEEVEVRAGDRVSFGAVRYRLAGPR
jgi:hypothetical protein